MQYRIESSRRFRKALKKYRRSGQFNEDKLRRAVDLLQSGHSLPRTHHDHQLKGELAGFRECHIESDLLLVYRIDENAQKLVLVDLGSHAELFGM